MPRYTLRTLLILSAIGPPLLAATWWWRDAIPDLVFGFLVGAVAMIALFGFAILAIILADAAQRWLAKIWRRCAGPIASKRGAQNE